MSAGDQGGQAPILSENEETRRKLAWEAAFLGDWSWDAVTDMVTFSDRAAEIFGMSSGPVMSWTDMQAFIEPGGRERAQQGVERAVAERTSYEVEYVVRRPGDGQRVWVLAMGRAFYDDSGAAKGMYGVVADVSAHKRVEAELQAERDRMIALQRVQSFLLELTDLLRPLSSPADMLEVATEALGRRLDVSRVGYGEVNDALTTLTVQRDWTDGRLISSVGDHNMDQLGASLTQDLLAGCTMMIEDVSADSRAAGTIVAALGIGAVLTVPLHRRGRLAAVLFVDSVTPRVWSIEDRAIVEQTAARIWAEVQRGRAEASLRESEARARRAEADLRESEARLRLVQEAGCIGSFDWDMKTGAIHRSPEYLKLQGLASDEAQGKYTDDWLSRVHLDDRDRVARAFEQDVRTPGPFEREYRIVRPSDGETRWLLNRGRVEVDETGAPARLVSAQSDITGHKRIEQALRESEHRLRLALDGSAMGDWSWDARTDMVTLSDRAAKILGVSRQQTTWSELQWTFEANWPAAAEDVKRAVALRASHETEIKVKRRNDQRPMWLSIRGMALFDEQGALSGLIGLVADITAKKEGEEAERLLIREVDHRAKNVLAVVQSLVNLTPFTTREEYRAALIGRISALARVHSLLSRRRWVSVRLDEIVQGELEPHVSSGEGRIRISGPPIEVRPEIVQPISLIIHELTTNAAKYGALASRTGHVEAAWLWADGRLDFHWIETGAQNTAAPSKQGFGAVLIDNAIQQIQGRIERAWLPSGLHCTIRLSQHFAAGFEKTSGRKSLKQANPAASLSGARVLLVEDEALVAMEMSALLQEAGADVIGPAHTLDDALSLALQDGIDCAVLDVNLGGRSIRPVVDTLGGRRVPVILLTGYENPDIEGRVLHKPVAHEALIAAISDALRA